MKLNYEKYMKKLYMLLNACEAPACISEEMADDIYEDVAALYGCPRPEGAPITQRRHHLQ